MAIEKLKIHNKAQK